MPGGSGYIVYKPFKYGRLNVIQDDQGKSDLGESGGGYSLSFVLNMLEDLWTKAIEEYLEVEKKDFKARTYTAYIQTSPSYIGLSRMLNN